jgi:hypothetical protein
MLRNARDNRQPQTTARRLITRRAKKAICQAVEIVVRNARSVVAHGDLDPVGHMLHRYFDTAARAPVFDRVIEQIVEQNADQHGLRIDLGTHVAR